MAFFRNSSRRGFLRLMGQAGAGAGLASVTAAASCATGRPPALPAFSPDREDFWDLVREQYPLTRDRTYLNTGGLGPAPYRVLDAMQDVLMELQRVSEHGYRRLAPARETAAEFFGANAAEVAFMRNATEGNATVASGIALEAGDEVIFESHAHPGGAMPWMVRQKEHGIVVRIFDPDPDSARGNVNRIRDLITPRTKVVQVSHITAPTGIRMPVHDIAELCRERDLWFHIDGAQSAGAIQFDLHDIGCDSYATSGHKWMGAPVGTGLLYVRADRLDRIVPTEAGAYSNSDYELPDVFDYNPTAQRFEPGTRDAAAVVGFQEAVSFLRHIGMDRIESYSGELAGYLQSKLRETPGVTVLTPQDPDRRGPITTFRTEGVSYTDLFGFLLREHKLRCRVVSERGLNALRVSTHIFNSKKECDEVVAGVIDAMQSADKKM